MYAIGDIPTDVAYSLPSRTLDGPSAELRLRVGVIIFCPAIHPPVLMRRPADIGLLVRDRRRAAGWSQAALAERVGSSRQWVVDLERGNDGAEIGRVLRALALLGISLDALIASGTHERSTGMPSLDEILGEHADAPAPPDAPARHSPSPRGTSRGRGSR